jgi:major membrane immunogen (membrane-anchored lipoprotein)
MRHYLILSASLLALAACGKSDEQTITIKEDDGSTATATIGKSDKQTITITGADGNTATATANGDKVTIKSNEGNMTIEQNGTAKFPDGAPQYPGSKITSTMNSNGDGKNSNMVEIETNDQPADVLAFYKAKMIAAKRPIAGEVTTSPTSGMIMSGGDKDSLMINVERKNDKTVAVIITSKGY